MKFNNAINGQSPQKQNTKQGKTLKQETLHKGSTLSLKIITVSIIIYDLDDIMSKNTDNRFKVHKDIFM
jgi:hypothetical protein